MTGDGKHKPIISQPDFLKESFVPSPIMRRENQLAEIKSALIPFVRMTRPTHIWITGPSGSGKTLMARHTMNFMGERHNVSTLYINCWEHCSLHSIMDKIMRDLRMLGAEKISTVFKLECFTRYLDKNFATLVLDEIDQLMPKDRNLILYNLCDMNKLSLVCISSSRNCFFTLDDRIRSRLNPKLIEVPYYTTEDLRHILRQRAEASLFPEAWDDSVIEKISALSRGDARVAIRTLWNAAVFAQNENCLEIKPPHLDKAWVSAKTIKKSVVLSALTVHHRLIHQIVAENAESGILSRPIWQLYLERCKRKKLQPVASRTFSLYLKQLMTKGLVRWERAAIKGNVRILRPAGNGNGNGFY
jgi:cell division control protein 6